MAARKRERIGSNTYVIEWGSPESLPYQGSTSRPYRVHPGYTIVKTIHQHEFVARIVVEGTQVMFEVASVNARDWSRHDTPTRAWVDAIAASGCPYSGKVAAAKMFGLRNDSYLRHWGGSAVSTSSHAAPASKTEGSPTDPAESISIAVSNAATASVDDKQRIERLEKELQEARAVIAELRSEIDRLARWQH